MRVLITGSHGLIGSACVRFFIENGAEVWGMDSDERAKFFGPSASTASVGAYLKKKYPSYIHLDIDITYRVRVWEALHHIKPDAIIHCAAQPSHDWAATDVMRDFDINARGTLILLEGARLEVPECDFIHMSTNKVYGDYPNTLDYIEYPTRYELDHGYSWAGCGFSESVRIDYTMHSLFGSSKLTGDIYAQEYGKYYGMRTTILRGGCLTGPAHAGTELHGFLSYVFMAGMQDIEYTIYGYGGKQVRDNIHADDVASAIWEIVTGQDPIPGEVYNIGGEMVRACSVLEAIIAVEEHIGRKMRINPYGYPRKGDHIWYVTDMSKFRMKYPEWDHTYSLEGIYNELYQSYEGLL